MQGVESLGQHLVKCQQRLGIVSLKECIHKRKAVFIIQHIKIAEYILILDVSTAECDSLVKDREGITHGTIRLVRYHMKRLIVYCYTFA